MFTSSVSSAPSTPTYSAPSETAGTIAHVTPPSIFSIETAGTVASNSSGFSIIA